MRNHARLVALGQQQTHRFSSARSKVQRPIVYVHADEPIGLLTEDGSVYLLMAEEHHPRRDGLSDLRTKLIDEMAYVVTVNGTETALNGQKAIFVQGFVRKK